MPIEIVLDVHDDTQLRGGVIVHSFRHLTVVSLEPHPGLVRHISLPYSAPREGRWHYAPC